MKYFIYTKNITNNTERVQCIGKESYEQDKYWLLGLPFFMEKGQFFGSVHNWNKPDGDIFLAEFRELNKRYEFNRLHTNTSRDLKIENVAKNQILNREVNSGFYFTTALPFVFNYKTNEEFVLDKNDFDLKENIFIKDVLQTKDKLYFLVSEEEQTFRYSFDLKTKKKEDKMLIGRYVHIKFLSTDKYLVVEDNKLHIITR